MYERLTQRTELGTAVFNNEDIGNIAKKLCDLEDKIEQGKIVELPCKVGQAVYYPIRHINKVVQLFVSEIVYTSSKIQFYASYLAFTVDGIGKTVFLTREEAERALERSEE